MAEFTVLPLLPVSLYVGTNMYIQENVQSTSKSLDCLRDGAHTLLQFRAISMLLPRHILTNFQNPIHIINVRAMSMLFLLLVTHVIAIIPVHITIIFHSQPYHC